MEPTLISYNFPKKGADPFDEKSSDRFFADASGLSKLAAHADDFKNKKFIASIANTDNGFAIMKKIAIIENGEISKSWYFDSNPSPLKNYFLSPRFCIYTANSNTSDDEYKIENTAKYQKYLEPTDWNTDYTKALQLATQVSKVESIKLMVAVYHDTIIWPSKGIELPDLLYDFPKVGVNPFELNSDNRYFAYGPGFTKASDNIDDFEVNRFLPLVYPQYYDSGNPYNNDIFINTKLAVIQNGKLMRKWLGVNNDLFDHIYIQEERYSIFFNKSINPKKNEYDLSNYLLSKGYCVNLDWQTDYKQTEKLAIELSKKENFTLLISRTLMDYNALLNMR